MNKLVKVYHNLIRRYWKIGIADFSEDVIDENNHLKIKWIENPYANETWFADPFILSDNEKEFIILAEEFPFKTEKGRISRLIVSKTEWKITDVKVLLELDTHLSFPCYFRKNGYTYIYPENSASGKSIIYKYNEQAELLSPVGILNGNPLTDAVCYNIEGQEYILSTRHPYENKNILDIYKANGVRSEIIPIQTVTFEENIARNAGVPFVSKGTLVRPAQICNTGYGEGILLQAVSFNDGKFSFKELKRMYSPLNTCPIAFHTMNVFDNRYIVFDAQGYKHMTLGPWIDKIACFCRNMFH